MGLLSTVVSGPLFKLECVLSLIYSLKFKMTLKPKHEVKSDPGLAPLTFLAGPTKMPLQYNKLVLSIEKHNQQTYIFALLSYSPETPNLGQIRRFLEPCDLEIWRMTLQNNSAPLLCYFKLCAAFRNHWWIQTGVTVRKRPICVKFDDF